LQCWMSAEIFARLGPKLSNEFENGGIKKLKEGEAITIRFPCSTKDLKMENVWSVINKVISERPFNLGVMESGQGVTYKALYNGDNEVAVLKIDVDCSDDCITVKFHRDGLEKADFSPHEFLKLIKEQQKIKKELYDAKVLYQKQEEEYFKVCPEVMEFINRPDSEKEETCPQDCVKCKHWNDIVITLQNCRAEVNKKESQYNQADENIATALKAVSKTWGWWVFHFMLYVRKRITQ